METVTCFVRAWTYQTPRFDRDIQAIRAGATKCTEDDICASVLALTYLFHSPTSRHTTTKLQEKVPNVQL